MKEYKVLVQHYGDKQYFAGDTRLLSDGDAKQLIALGLVAPRDEAAQADVIEPELPEDDHAEVAEVAAAEAETRKRKKTTE